MNADLICVHPQKSAAKFWLSYRVLRGCGASRFLRGGRGLDQRGASHRSDTSDSSSSRLTHNGSFESYYRNVDTVGRTCHASPCLAGTRSPSPENVHATPHATVRPNQSAFF